MDEEKIKKMEEELARLSKLVYHDELTGILNRRGFIEEAERAFHLVSFGNSSLERRTGFQIPFSIIFLDIDNFKALNDTYGHAAGDAALKLVADMMHRTLRSGDLFGRLGGEEFVVALIGAGATLAARVAEKLRKGLDKTEFVWEGQRVPLTASFGTAQYSHEATLRDLIEKADKAMYQAKQAGKNKVVVGGR